ncbi:Hint domain-containing protein [Tabrizicola sp.]|uniref:Hint domain-containing protein n=1 Tax=Tabrizicola sp. TaxID=2005166 RepID=UPI0035B4443B
MDFEAPFSRSAGGEGIEAQPGILAGTMVRTLDGVLPVEYLTPGDRIVTRNGARRLTSVSVQARKMVDLVRIRASTLGHDRPEQDLLVSPGQPILIRDWRARAIFGTPVAAIPASRLADGEFVCLESHRQVRLFTLRFDEDEVIYAEGLELACPALLPELA